MENKLNFNVNDITEKVKNWATFKPGDVKRKIMLFKTHPTPEEVGVHKISRKDDSDHKMTLKFWITAKSYPTTNGRSFISSGIDFSGESNFSIRTMSAVVHKDKNGELKVTNNLNSHSGNLFIKLLNNFEFDLTGVDLEDFAFIFLGTMSSLFTSDKVSLLKLLSEKIHVRSLSNLKLIDGFDPLKGYIEELIDALKNIYSQNELIDHIRKDEVQNRTPLTLQQPIKKGVKITWPDIYNIVAEFFFGNITEDEMYKWIVNYSNKNFKRSRGYAGISIRFIEFLWHLNFAISSMRIDMNDTTLDYSLDYNKMMEFGLKDDLIISVLAVQSDIALMQKRDFKKYKL